MQRKRKKKENDASVTDGRPFKCCRHTSGPFEVSLESVEKKNLYGLRVMGTQTPSR